MNSTNSGDDDSKQREFQLGDTVDWNGAIGTVVRDDSPRPFNLKVRFRSGTHSFTYDGRYLGEQTNSCLKLIKTSL